MLHLRVETSKVESVEDVVFLHFAKVFVALRRQEPRDPLSFSVKTCLPKMTTYDTELPTCSADET